MTEDQRKEIVNRATRRIIKNLDQLSGYSKVAYITPLVNMLDDIHLQALDFALEMTPELSEKAEGK